jgi:hypothetical protein
MENNNMFCDKRRRKLSVDSVVHQFYELDNLRKEFELAFMSKGEIYIHNEFARIKNKLNTMAHCKDPTVEQQANFESDKLALLERIEAEKLNLIDGLNILKWKIDSQFDEIKAQVETLKEPPLADDDESSGFRLREMILTLKDQIKNSLIHFSNLINFNLDLFHKSNSTLMTQLEIYPRKFYLAKDIVTRLEDNSKTRPSRHQCVQLSASQVATNVLWTPVCGHQVLTLEFYPFRISLFNRDGELKCHLNELDATKETIVWIKFAVSEHNIFVLFQNESGKLFLQSYDYKLNRLRSIRLERDNAYNESLNMKVMGKELFVVRLNN